MAAMETQMIQQAYLFALDPTQAQAATLASHAGARRYAFNWAHAMIAAAADARQAQKDAGLEPDIAIPGQFEVGPAWTRCRSARKQAWTAPPSPMSWPGWKQPVCSNASPAASTAARNS